VGGLPLIDGWYTEPTGDGIRMSRVRATIEKKERERRKEAVVVEGDCPRPVL
jgi:hypothetical protein